MAQSRKSHIIRKEKVKTQPKRYVIYCDFKKEGDPYGRTLVPVFFDMDCAKMFFTNIVGTDEWEWVKPKDWREPHIMTSSGIKLHGSPGCDGKDLRAIIDHGVEDHDEEFYRQHITLFRYGRHEALAPKEDPQIVEAKKERKVKKAKKAKRPKVDKSKMVTANDIAKDIGRLGREVRAVLRGKMEKPPHGWAWPKNEGATITKKVKKLLKEADARKKRKKK